MSDKLKQFIVDNRGAFDSDKPGPGLLRKLRQQLGQGSQSKNVYQIKSIRWAAAIAGLIILSVVLYFTTQQQNAKDGIVRTPGENIEEKISVSEPVYAKQIGHYQEMIGLQQTELRRVEKEQPELYRQFAKDINQLDSAYRVLKITLTTNPNREMLLEAMIRNLQFQSDLLNRQLLIIQEIKQKGKAYEKSTI
jgi:hypothetical protein